MCLKLYRLIMSLVINLCLTVLNKLLYKTNSTLTHINMFMCMDMFMYAYKKDYLKIGI